MNAHRNRPATTRDSSAPARVDAAREPGPGRDRLPAGGRAARASEARQASGRRRGVDPTTSDRDYSAPEREFLAAMDAYKRTSGRLFPTWSEVLEVIQGLGYEKADD